VVDYCRTRFGFAEVEHLHLLFLNNNNNLFYEETMQRGTINQTPIFPREIAKRALEKQAAALIMVHNHPSGDPTPSKADIQLTKQVQEALKAVGVTLHDHLIVAQNRHSSFRGMGFILEP
jgi:DNA repair protein RadC